MARARAAAGGGAASAGDDGDAGDAVRRQLVHDRDDVAVSGLPVAAQLDDSVGIAEPRLDRRRQLIARNLVLADRNRAVLGDDDHDRLLGFERLRPSSRLAG